MGTRLSCLAPFPPVIAALATGLLIHEMGHAIAAVLSGGVVADVVLLSATPHVFVIGRGSDCVEAFRAAAGSCFVIVISLASMLVRAKRWLLFIETLGLFCFVELTGWTGSLLLSDKSPNDAADFLQFSGMSRHVVIFICVLLGALYVRLRASWLRRCAALGAPDPSNSPQALSQSISVQAEVSVA